MDIDTVVRALRCVQEKHRNDRLLTFQTDVSAMARDAADLIESLQAEITQLKDELADYNCDTKIGCKLIEEVKAERDAAVAENERLAKHGGKYIQLSDERYKMYEKAVKRAEDAEIKLAASQRREKAAVDNCVALVGLIADRLAEGSIDMLCKLANELEVIVADQYSPQDEKGDSNER